ncbi:MAG: hypothetical protein K2J31_03430 [Alistipes sp.]|nr:hypothetical protein [Alistipes sp.]MDE6861784.1 hypothetical protein [Alistipes sp.]MDE7129984.1 hypothetical protein [Alistipes sp.]
MNKFVYVLVICAALLGMACSSSSDRAVNTTPESLEGTSWFGECEDEKTGRKYDATLSFLDDGRCTWELRDGIGDLFSLDEYVYEYTMPNLTLYVTDQEDEANDLKIIYNGFVLDKDQAVMNGYNVYTIWLYDVKSNLAASFWKF